MTVIIEKILYHDSKHGGYSANIVEATVRDNGTKKLITFYREGSRDYGSEVYVGENYIAGDLGRSYSRNYIKFKKLPSKYKPIIKELMKIHRKRYG